MKTFSLRTQILIPLMLAIAILLGTFIFSFSHSLKESMLRHVEEHLAVVGDIYEEHVEFEAKMMGADLAVMQSNQKIRDALEAKDRETLLELSRPLFEKLSLDHRISHLYFMGIDRVNILRVHKPEKYGDTIDRFTILEAEKTGSLSYGIELGPLGTFTLRVVQPWYKGRHLIGYVELGEEIEDIMHFIQKIMHVKTFIFLEKRHLDRASWESGMRMLGRKSNWEQFPRRLSENSSGPEKKQLTNEQNPLKDYRRKTI